MIIIIYDFILSNSDLGTKHSPKWFHRSKRSTTNATIIFYPPRTKRNHYTTMKEHRSSSNTLVFASSDSFNMPWIMNPEESVIPSQRLSHDGIYSCTLSDSFCSNTQKVANSKNGDYGHGGLLLRNLAFYVSSKNKKDTSSHSGTDQIEESNDKSNDDGNNYMYGGATYDHHHDTGANIYSWEILRSNLDNNGGIHFHSYFKTLTKCSWNNCDFDCCPFKNGPDSNGFHANRDRHDFAFMHAYVLAIPRAFAVDDNTGDIFISWEGFYKNCDPANHFQATPMLEWTVGVSRLVTHTENPSCVAVRDENGDPLSFSDLSNNFAQCTVPVSIVAMETHGRNIQLPYGGLTVIPAAKEPPAPGVQPRRTFLLSVLDPSVGETHLWAMPENADVTENRYMRQELHSSHLGRHILQQNEGIWNSGNIRVHYNQETGRPDHVCRSVFDKGIRCIPISLTEDASSTYVTVTGDEEIFLTEEHVQSFCVYPDATLAAQKQPFYKYKSTIATGLDVVWNEEDGTPQKIYFGCWGFRQAGRLGSVEKDGANLIDVLPGAHSGDVIFLPRELAVSTVRTPLEGEMPSSFDLNRTTNGVFYGLAIAGVLFVAGAALYGFYKKKLTSPSRSDYEAVNWKKVDSRPTSLPITSMELPVIATSSSTTTSSSAELSPSSSSSELENFLPSNITA